MDDKGLKRLLETTGMKVYYGHFTGEHKMPYLTYREVMTMDFSADNRALKRYRRYDVDLYTKGKQTSANRSVERLLDDAGIRFRALEYEAPDGAFVQTVYEIRLTDE